MSNFNMLSNCHSSWTIITGFSWPIHNYFYVSEQLHLGNWSQTYNDGQLHMNHLTTTNEKHTGLDFLDVQWQCSKSHIFFLAPFAHPWRKTVSQFTKNLQPSSTKQPLWEISSVICEDERLFYPVRPRMLSLP